MKEKIINILEKYEDLIMKYTLGSKRDEDGERYAEGYCHEWKVHKHDISLTISEMLNNNYTVSSEGFAYVIIAEWSGVMIFEHQALDVKKLRALCKKMLNELLMQ